LFLWYNIISKMPQKEYSENRIVRWAYPIIKKILGPIVRGFWIKKVEGLENIAAEGTML